MKQIKKFTALQGDVCLRTTPEGDKSELHESKGYVQIFDYGKWKNICDATWGATEATVVCQQLGLVAVSQFVASSVSIGNVICTGKEKKLDDCVHPSWSEDCKEGVHVTCSTTNPGIMLISINIYVYLSFLLNSFKYAECSVHHVKRTLPSCEWKQVVCDILGEITFLTSFLSIEVLENGTL